MKNYLYKEARYNDLRHILLLHLTIFSLYNSFTLLLIHHSNINRSIAPHLAVLPQVFSTEWCKVLTLRKNALLRFLLKSHFLAQIGLLKRFLQKVHDNFSSIEEKMISCFLWKIAFKIVKHQKQIDQMCLNQKLRHFCQGYLKSRFACLNDFSQSFSNIFKWFSKTAVYSFSLSPK